MHIASSPKLLSDKEAKALIKKAQNGEESAKEKLVECNIRLVNSIAMRFKNMGKEYEDIFQVGCLGLVKAINNFNLEYNVCFSTYAVPLIMGEIRRFLRDDMPISVSRTVKEQAQIVKKGREELCAKLGNEPTLSQLAEYLKMTPEEINMALEAMRPVSSIYDTTNHDNGDSVYLLDYLAAEKEEGNFDKLFLDLMINELPQREKKIIELRYKDDKTQSEIGEMMNISQVQVSRIEKAALIKLREKIQKTDF